MSEKPRRPAGAPEEPPAPAAEPTEEIREPRTPAGKDEAVAGSEEAAVSRDIDAMLEETRRERDEYLELAQRTRADFENYRKRVSAEAADATRKGKAQLAADLVGALDNLERAVAAAAARDGDSDGSLEQGILMTERQLRGALEGAGVEAIDPAGEKFDPAWHEAVSTVADGKTSSGTVVEVLQKGYRIGPQLIRPARVVVSE
jgi:molecular chaperone GrpE